MKAAPPLQPFASSRDGTTPAFGRRWWLGVAATILMLAVIGLPLAVAPEMLMRRDALAPADAIVVLGGGPSSRPQVAAELYRRGLASSVLISGTGDCHKVQRLLEQFGVAADHILIECNSRTTRENVLLSAPILREHQLRRVILVTSWQHSARAAQSFAELAPDLDILSYPTQPRTSWPPIRSLHEAAAVYEEYVKFGWYCVAYRLCA